MVRLFRTRTLFIAVVHVVLFAAAYAMAHMIRFEFTIPEQRRPLFWATLGLVVGIKFAAFYLFRQYRSWLRYVSLDDMKKIVVAASVAEVSLLVFERFVLLYATKIPRSIFLLDWGLTIALVAGTRLVIRMVREARWPLIVGRDRRKVLIVGAGDAGEGLLRELRRRPELGYVVLGFLDDDPRKHGARVAGVPVLGPIDRASGLAETYEVQEAIIALPSASRDEMRRIVAKLRKAELSFRTLPGVAEIIAGEVSADQIRNVTINELLGRQPVSLDAGRIAALIDGKVVAVTGAGGSIGSELSRQILGFGPARLLLIDWSENGLFEIDRELGQKRAAGGSGSDRATDVVPCIADVSDRPRIDRLFSEHGPGVVFHAAAHKHVPMMELNPCEAVKNNVFGTKVVADVAAARGVEHFVLISTDKAVNPVSVMGMTKRVAELYVHALGQAGGTGFVVVRFGNVLGSSGSVVPIFKEQIEKGGPVTVTHPDMSRYFMTIPEAVQLVLQAAAIGKAGEILVLDMGEPVKIVDLARELIGLSGLREPQDIQIAFTGVRPGEKLHEELWGRGEEPAPSAHEKIHIAMGAKPAIEELLPQLAFLEEAALCGEDARVVRTLSEFTGGGAAADSGDEGRTTRTVLRR